MTKRKNNKRVLSIAAAITISLGGVATTREKHLIPIRCDTPGTNGFFIVNDKSSYANAAAACTAKGGALADLTNSNFANAVDIISTCVGSDKTWIGSWNYKSGSTESQDCLTAHVAGGNSGGYIDQICSSQNAVLCQTQTSNVPHNPNYIETGPGTHISVRPFPENGNSGKSNWGESGYSHNYGGGPIVPVGPIYDGFQIPSFPQYGNSYGGPPHPYGLPPPYGSPGSWKNKGDKYQHKAGESMTVTVIERLPFTVTEPGGAPKTSTVFENKPVTITESGPGPAAATVTVLEQGHVTVTGTASNTVTITLPASNATTATVTMPASGAITVTEPASNATTVTVIEQDQVTVTEPAPEPVTITEPVPITKPVTSIVTLTEQTITITEKGIPQTVTVPPITTTITIDVPKTIAVPTIVTIEAEPVTVTKNVTNYVTTVETETKRVTDYVTTVETEVNKVTDYVTSFETEINKVTDYITSFDTEISELTNFVIDTVTSTESTTATATAFVTMTNTITDSLTEFVTHTEVKTLEPVTITLSASTITLEPNTVTLEPEVVTVGPGTVTLPANTVTLPPDIVTLPPNTVTLPPSTITLQASTVTLPKETSFITLPASTSLVYAVHDVIKTNTIYQQLPAQTINRFVTTTLTTTKIDFKIFSTTITSTSTLPQVTITETAGQACAASTGESGSLEEWVFPFEIKNFNGAGIYTLSNHGVVEVGFGGSYTFVSGGPPGGGPLSGSFTLHSGDSGNSGDTFAFNFAFPEFNGPGIYTRTNGIITVLDDGSYTWLSGGPSSSNSSGDGVTFSFPFSVPGFKGDPGIFTLENGAVITVKYDGSYTFLSGTAPNGRGGHGPSRLSPSFVFPFSIPGYKGSPGQFTLDNGAVITVKPNGSYSILSGNAPNGAPNTGKGNPVNPGGGRDDDDGIRFVFPFSIPGFKGLPGHFTLDNGAVITVKSDGSYTILSGNAPNGAPNSSSGNSNNGGGGGGGHADHDGHSGTTFSFPFNIPGFTGKPGKYTLSNNAIITVNSDGSYNFLSGSAPSSSGSASSSSGSAPSSSGSASSSSGSASSSSGSASSSSGSAPSSSGISSNSNSIGSSPGIYTLSNNAIVSVRSDGSYTYLSNPNSGSSSIIAAQSGFNAFSLPSFSRRSSTASKLI